MLSGFECDEDHTTWVAGAALWASGAVAGCMLALVAAADGTATIAHWQVLILACVVSLVSLGIRLPVLFANCAIPAWLTHAVWMIALFAQINWAGFLAMRAPNVTVAAEAILACWGIELWLFLVCRNKLRWLPQLFGRPLLESQSAQQTGTSSIAHARERFDTSDEEQGDVRRELVDGIDEDGRRYLSGSVRIVFEPYQRIETVVLGFCPAFDAPVHLELECDTEEVSAKVEHATETGARIVVRRQSAMEQLSRQQLCTNLEWFAQVSDAPAEVRSLNLP